MGHLLEYILFQLAGLILRRFPLRTVQRTGAWMGAFVGMTLGYRRAITMDNLRNAFPEAGDEELTNTMQGAFRSVGTALFEFVWTPRLTRETIHEIISLANRDLITEVFARGKGVILLTAHFGNWEMLALSIPAITGIPVHVIVKPQANRRIDSRINSWRTAFGNIAVPMESAVRELLKVLRDKKAVGIVGDQAAAKESMSVSFFGREVPTFEGPAMFSLKTGAPLLLGLAVRGADGRYTVQFHEVPTSDLGAYTKENVAELTRRHVALTESIIRQYPDQWMWMHKRWKHVPSRSSSDDSPVKA